MRQSNILTTEDEGYGLKRQARLYYEFTDSGRRIAFETLKAVQFQGTILVFTIELLPSRAPAQSHCRWREYA